MQSQQPMSNISSELLKAWELDDHRFALRLLLGWSLTESWANRDLPRFVPFWAGAHLMEISRLEGLTTEVYAEAKRDPLW